MSASDARRFGEHFFLVTELLDGVTLRELMRPRPTRAVADAAEVARQLALGVKCLADHGLVHRDLSPANVMVTTAGRVAILDLGLAALAAGGDRLTDTGLFVGTVGYLSPEQSEDPRAVDHRSDLYAVGCLLHALLVGHAPFRERAAVSVREWLNRLCSEAPSDLRRVRPDVPDAVAEVCDGLLATRSADRPSDPAAVADRLAPTEITNSVGMRLRRIPAGEFVMGSPPREWGRMDRGDVETQHRVAIPGPTYVGVFEVAQGEYRAVTGTTPSRYGPSGSDAAAVANLPWEALPVDPVSWSGAVEFCRLLTARPAERGRPHVPAADRGGGGIRLPGRHNDGLPRRPDAVVVPGQHPPGPGLRPRAADRSSPRPPAAGGEFPGQPLRFARPARKCDGVDGDGRPNDLERRITRGGHWLLAARDGRSATRGCDGDNGTINYGAESAGPQCGFRVWCDVPPRE